MTPTSEKSVGTAHDGMTIPCDDTIALSPALVKPPARAFIALEREKSPRVLRVALDYEVRLIDQSFRVKRIAFAADQKTRPTRNGHTRPRAM